MNIAPATLTPLVLAGASAETRDRAQRWSDVVKRMARLAEISFADRAPEGAVQLLVRGETVALPLKGVIDLSAERARLDKEIAKADADIKRGRRQARQREIRRQRAGRDRRGRKRKARGGGGAQGENPRGAGAAEERFLTARPFWNTTARFCGTPTAIASRRSAITQCEGDLPFFFAASSAGRFPDARSPSALARRHAPA